MKVIVTRQNDDKSYDDVGMNNRRLFSDLKTIRGVVNRLKRARFASGKTVRLEIFYGNIYKANPDKVEYFSLPA